MKEHLKKLYEKNKRHWEVWVWLWMQSDTKNSTIFTYRVICARFNVPKSTFARVIESQSVWNDEKITFLRSITLNGNSTGLFTRTLKWH